MSSATTITITTGRPAALVAFRDGVAGPWQAATMKTPTSFEAQVHGPYLVSVVCNDMFTNPGGTFESWDTWQVGRTLDNPHTFATCDVPAQSHAITGHMVQAGTVTLGSSFASSSTADWNVKLSAASGTYDLIAKTNDGAAVQRGLAVSGDLALADPIDVVQHGTAFVTAAFSVTNAMPAETLRAAAFLEVPSNTLTATLYSGPPDAVKILPEAGLLNTDRQTVSLRASSATANGTALRAFRRPFRVGGDTSYTLPAPLGNPQWTVAGMQAAVSWTQLPVIGNLSEMITGMAPGGTKPAMYDLELTQSFVAATSPTQAIIDINIPGYQPAWRVDLTLGYTRQLFIQRIPDDTVTSLSIDETIAAQAAVHTAPRAGRAAAAARSAPL
jgi:hypothetical protein